ncbi:tryptophan--tRNA ligase, partial [Vibrio anguillarum]|nr:tryptophan--tRNA ligase [Vibrio anguillarum]
PIRERRTEFLSDKAQLVDILVKGSKISRDKTTEVLFDVKNIFGLNIF